MSGPRLYLARPRLRCSYRTNPDSFDLSPNLFLPSSSTCIAAEVGIRFRSSVGVLGDFDEEEKEKKVKESQTLLHELQKVTHR